VTAQSHPDNIEAVLFDVNETLSDLSSMAQRFTKIGAPEEWSRLWFASVLRDGFALTVTGVNPAFSEVAAGVLRTMLGELDTHADTDAASDRAVATVMQGFSELPVHSDVPAGVRELRLRGLRLNTLSNGALSVAEDLLSRAGLREDFEQVLSVSDAPAWKPHPAAYAYGAQALGLPRSAVLLIAVHPWDIDGAARAGLRTGWLNRGGRRYPTHFRPPDHSATSLPGLAAALG